MVFGCANGLDNHNDSLLDFYGFCINFVVLFVGANKLHVDCQRQLKFDTNCPASANEY